MADEQGAIPEAIRLEDEWFTLSRRADEDTGNEGEDMAALGIRDGYEQAFADHSYLWQTYGPASDMTGAYVDQEDLAKLLRSPTKATARDCLVIQIEYWFDVGTEAHSNPIDPNDPELIEIAERYGATLTTQGGAEG